MSTGILYLTLCVEVLRPRQPNGAILSAVSSVPNHMLMGRLNPLSGQPVFGTFIRQKLTTAFLESVGVNDRRKYSMINLHERMLPPGSGRTRNHLIFSRTHIKLSHEIGLTLCTSPFPIKGVLD